MSLLKTQKLLDSLILDLEKSLGLPSSKDAKDSGVKGSSAAAPAKNEPAAKEAANKKESEKKGDQVKKTEKKEDGAKSEKKADKKGEAKAAAPPAEAKAAAEADQAEFTKLELKVGVLTKTWAHPESEKLFCEEIDVGEAAPRSVASGLRAFYTLEQFCPGKKVVVVTNLKPAKMAGFESQGMVMAATTADHSQVKLLEPPADAKVGERVYLEGVSGEAYNPNQVQKKKVLPAVLADLKTDGSCVACWQGRPLLTSAGP
eukprot:CAMPEP_0172177892 /NCGR_PEP_ID=MMETSP1050-20130122/15714_1 /TAXON_ID=233186 /ORGANISM="Cryptomonas curvata, Strain CCAP979/52" /LENGTH=258 /DNA_ID=CAMNT_0012850513 /DNA_START=16 /DNA_END=789 /DNA_ORIENTATION=+